MKKIKIYKTILLFLIIAIIIVSILIIIKYAKRYKTEKNAKSIIQNIKQENLQSQNLTDEINEEIDGYKVIGIIKIPKINIEYPILEKTTIESLNLSITRFWGNKINEIGNVTLAGHNNLNGKMFGKINKLEKGDIIEITDAQNITIKYEVFDTYVVDPNDISCIMQVEEGTREVTLITCKNGRSNRFIVKAREIINK